MWQCDDGDLFLRSRPLGVSARWTNDFPRVNEGNKATNRKAQQYQPTTSTTTTLLFVCVCVVSGKKALWPEAAAVFLLRCAVFGISLYIHVLSRSFCGCDHPLILSSISYTTTTKTLIFKLIDWSASSQKKLNDSSPARIILCFFSIIFQGIVKKEVR